MNPLRSTSGHELGLESLFTRDRDEAFGPIVTVDGVPIDVESIRRLDEPGLPSKSHDRFIGSGFSGIHADELDVLILILELMHMLYDERLPWLTLAAQRH
jgi:hypothetical protein